MIPLHRVARLLYNRPLFTLPSAAETVSSVFLSHVDARAGGALNDEAFGDSVTFFRANERPDGSVEMHSPRASRFHGEYQVGSDGRPLPFRVAHDGRTAILTVIGELVHRGAWIGASCGLVSYEGLKHQLAVAEADPKIRNIVMDLETPGGEAVGCFDLAAAVRRVAKTKRVISVVNGMACSAGYALASGSSEIVSIADGLTGSIGVVYMHLDFSKYLERSGIKPTLIHAGAHKVDGNPYEPLPDEVRNELQAEIERFYSMFVEGVAAGRKNMTPEQIRGTEARVYLGAEALEVGLIDRVATFEQVMEELAAPRVAGRVTNTQGGTMSRKAKAAVSAEAQTDDQKETTPAAETEPKAGPGACSECECTAFVGEGETCEAEGCGHANASHAADTAGDEDGDEDTEGSADTEGANASATAPLAPAANTGEDSELERLRRENAAYRQELIKSQVSETIAKAVAAKKFGAADPSGTRPTLAGSLSVLLTKAHAGEKITAQELEGVIALMPASAPEGKLTNLAKVPEAASINPALSEHENVVQHLATKGIHPGDRKWSAEYKKAISEVRTATTNAPA